MKKEATIRAYIQSEPPQARAALKKMHALLRKAVPKAGEKLAWGMPTLTLGGNLFHFAAFKNHMSLFPGTKVVEKFRPRLGKFTTTKAAIHFPYGEPLPTALITAIAKHCVKLDQEKVKARAAKKKRAR